MHLMKVKRKIFKREFLDFKLVVVVYDVCQLSREEENTVIEVNRIFWVLPIIRGMELDEQQLDRMLPPR